MFGVFPVKTDKFKTSDGTIVIQVDRLDNGKLSIVLRLRRWDGLCFMHRVTEYNGSSTFEHKSDADKLGIITESIKHVRRFSKT